MKNVTDASFDADVAQSDTPVLIDFWAPWCGPCKQIAPVLDKLDGTIEGLTIAKINVDENPATSAKFGIRGIPALMIFSKGTPISMLMGAQTEAAMRKWIDSEMTKV